MKHLGALVSSYRLVRASCRRALLPDGSRFNTKHQGLFSDRRYLRSRPRSTPGLGGGGRRGSLRMRVGRVSSRGSLSDCRHVHSLDLKCLEDILSERSIHTTVVRCEGSTRSDIKCSAKYSKDTAWRATACTTSGLEILCVRGRSLSLNIT